MRKYISSVLIVLMMIFLVSCTENPLPKTDIPEESPQSASAVATEAQHFAETSINPEVSAQDTSVETSPDLTEKSELSAIPYPQNQLTLEQSEELYRTFLTNNYQSLNGSSSFGLTGLGLVDLDLDGVAELIAFNDGASAAMGVEIFDIVGGEVECISSSIDEIYEKFGGEDSSKVYINCNFFDDFRLMQSKDKKEHFFAVISGNGNIDSEYTELIRFGLNGETLTLTQVSYKYEEYKVDPDSSEPEIITQEFQAAGSEILQKEYNRIISIYKDTYTDTDIEAKGVFGWEKSEYSGDFESFSKLMDEAFSLAKKNHELIYGSFDE